MSDFEWNNVLVPHTNQIHTHIYIVVIVVAAMALVFHSFSGQFSHDTYGGRIRWRGRYRGINPADACESRSRTGGIWCYKVEPRICGDLSDKRTRAYRVMHPPLQGIHGTTPACGQLHRCDIPGVTWAADWNQSRSTHRLTRPLFFYGLKIYYGQRKETAAEEFIGCSFILSYHFRNGTRSEDIYVIVFECLKDNHLINHYLMVVQCKCNIPAILAGSVPNMLQSSKIVISDLNWLQVTLLLFLLVLQRSFPL